MSGDDLFIPVRSGKSVGREKVSLLEDVDKKVSVGGRTHREQCDSPGGFLSALSLFNKEEAEVTGCPAIHPCYGTRDTTT